MAETPRTNLFLDILEEEEPNAAYEWRLKNPDRTPFGVEEQSLREQTALASRPLDASMPSIAQVPSNIPIQEFPEGVGFGEIEHFARKIIRTKAPVAAPAGSGLDHREGDTIGGAMSDAFRRGAGNLTGMLFSGTAGLAEMIGKQHEGAPSTFQSSPLVIENLGGFDAFGTADITRQAHVNQTTDTPRKRFYDYARQIDAIGADAKKWMMPERGQRVRDLSSIGSARDAVIYAAERIAEGVGSTVPMAMARIAGGPASIFASQLMGMGQMRDAFEQQGIKDSARRDSYMLVGGLMIGTLEAFALDRLARGYLSKEFLQHMASSIPKRVMWVGTTGMLTEGFVELAQDATEIGTIAEFKGEAVAKAVWDARMRLLESFVAGALAGGAMAAGTQSGREIGAGTMRVAGRIGLPNLSDLTPQQLPNAPARAPDFMFQQERERAEQEQQPATPEQPAAPEQPAVETPAAPNAERAPDRDEPEEPRPVYDQDELAVLIAATDGLTDEDHQAVRDAALSEKRADLARAARIYAETGDMARAVDELRTAILAPTPTPEGMEAETELTRFEEFTEAEPLTPDQRTEALNEIAAGADPRDAYENAGGTTETVDPRQLEHFEPLEAVLEDQVIQPQEAQATAVAAPGAQETAIDQTGDQERDEAAFEIAIEADRQLISDLREQMKEARGQRDVIAQLRAEIEQASKRVTDYNNRLRRLQERPAQPAAQPVITPTPDGGVAAIETAGPDAEAASKIKPKKRTWGGANSKTPATGLRLIDWIIRGGGIRPWTTKDGTVPGMFGTARPAEGIKAAAAKRFGKDATRRPGVFTAGGYTLDDAALWDALVESGYIPNYIGSDGTQLYDPAERIEDLLNDDLNGREVFSAEFDRTAEPINPDEEAHFILSEARSLYEANGLPWNLTEVEEERIVELVREGMPVDNAIERIYIEDQDGNEAGAAAEAPAADTGRQGSAAAGSSDTQADGAQRGGNADAGQARQQGGGAAETHIDPYAFSVVNVLKKAGYVSRDPDPDVRREAQIAAMQAAAQELRPYSFESLKAMAEAQKVYGGNPKTKDELIDVMLRGAAQRIANRRAAGGSAGGARFQLSPATATGFLSFYSQLRHELSRNKTGAAPGSQWLSVVKGLANKGVKKEEIQWSGLIPWLDENKATKLTREDILQFLEEHQIAVDERLLSDNAAPVKAAITDALRIRSNLIFSQRRRDFRTLRAYVDKVGLEQAARVLSNDDKIIYDRETNLAEVLDAIERSFPDLDKAMNDAGQVQSYEQFRIKAPAGREYDELLIRLPMLAGRYSSKHYFENEVVHVRFDVLDGPNGERMLRIIEIQSDLHQKGRDEGYGRQLTAEEYARIDEIDNVLLPALWTKEAAAFTEVSDAYTRAITRNPDSLPQLYEAARTHDQTYLELAIGDGTFHDGSRIFGTDYYGFEAAVRLEAADLFPEVMSPWTRLLEVRDEIDKLMQEMRELSRLRDGVPEAPFKDKAWLELALKRMLLHAVENKFDGITWARSDQIGPVVGATYIKSATWSTHSDRIEVEIQDSADNFKTRSYKIKKGNKDAALKELRRELGDEIAYQVDAEADGHLGNLAVPNIGLRLQYDHEIGEFLAKYTKQWDGKVDREAAEAYFDPALFWGDIEDAVMATADATQSDEVDDALRNLLADMSDQTNFGDPEADLSVLDGLLNALPDAALAEFLPRFEAVNARWHHDPATGLLTHPQGLSNEFLMVTDAMRQSVPEKGQALFQLGGQFSGRSPAHAARIRDAIQEAIRPMLPMLPAPVRVNVIERLGELDPETALELLESGFDPNRMSGAALPGKRRLIMSLSTRDPKQTFGHEVIHMLRGMGLIHDREWRALTRYANKKGILDQTLPGETRTLRERYEEAYAHLSPALREQVIMEEAIAWMLQARLVDGASFETPINSLLDRLIEFLIRLKNALLARGYRNDVDVIVGRIRSGEVAARSREMPQIEPLSAEAMTAQALLALGAAYRPVQAARIWQLGKYRVEREDGSPGQRTYYAYDRGSDTPVGYATALERDIGWEIEWTETSPGRRREGVNTAIYAAIEKDTGIPRQPSGTLTQKGYEAWRDRDPESVKHHRQWNGLWYSPKQIWINLQHYEEIAQATRNPAIQKTAANLRALWASIPANAKTPEKLQAMFQVRPEGFVNPPGGLRDAPERAGQGVAGTAAPRQSLREIIDTLARDLGLTVRQGRLSDAERRRARQQDGELLAQFDPATGVIRTQVYDDLNRISHEAGHQLATRFGDPLRSLIDTNDIELGPLDPLNNNPHEGFAEFVRRYLTNPTAAQRVAPGFYAEFSLFLTTTAPETLEILQNTQRAYTEWLASSSLGAVGLSVVSTADRTGFEVVQDMYAHARSHTLPEMLQQGAQQIDHVAAQAYWATFDRAHPIRRAVDWLTAVARNNLPNMPGTANLRILAANDPYNLFRMMKGAWEAGRSAIVNGVAPYSRLSGQLPTPQGPSLYQALTTAFGSDRWNRDQEREFGSYLKSRMMVMRFIQWRPELMQELRQHVAVNPQHAHLLTAAAVYERIALGDPANGIEGRPLPYQPDEFSFGDHLQNLVQLESANARLARGAEQYYGFVRNLVKKAYEAGLPGMTAEVYAELIARPNYAPMWRDMTEPGDVVPPDTVSGPGAGSMTQGNRRAVIKGEFRGSSRPVINPLESAMQMAYQIESAISYNESVAALANIARAAGPGGGVIAERLNPTQITGSQVHVQEVVERAAQELGIDPVDTALLIAQVNDLLGENAMATLYRRSEIRPATGERILWYGENGRLVPLLIGNAPLARTVFDTFHQFGGRSPQWDMVLSMLGLSTQVLRENIVVEPWFQLRNFMRDQISYFIQAPGYIPVWTGLRGLRHALMGSTFFRAYQSQGGMMGGPETNAIEPTKMKRRVAALQRGGFRIEWSAAGLKDVLRGFEFLETASRVGYAEIVYRRSIRQGLSPYEAMRQAVFESRDIMDFDKSGGWLATTRKLIPFLNANLVGLDRAARTLTGHDERNRGIVVQRILSPFASGGLRQSPVWAEVRHDDLPHYVQAWIRLAAVAAIYATIRMLHSGDNDDDESNDYENAVFAKIKVNGEWVFIPKPYDYAAFINLAEAGAMRLVRGNTRAMEGWITGLGHTTLPPHDVPFLKTYYGIQANYDNFFERPIVAPELLGLEAQLQYNAWTSEFSKKLSKVLSPVADISPAVIDYAITNQFGTWGRHFLSATNMFASDRRGQADWRDFTGGVVRPIERSTMSGQRFWQLMSKTGEYSVAAGTLERLSEMVSDPRAVGRYLDSLSPERRAYAILHMAGTKSQEQFHPLDRARTIHTVASGIMRAMDSDSLRATEKGRRKRKEPGEPIQLDARERLALRGLLQSIQYREQANALITMKEPGWTHRPLYAVDDDYAVLKARFPHVYDEMQRRFAANKVRPFGDVRGAWPAVRSTLLSDDVRNALLKRDYEAIEGALPSNRSPRRSNRRNEQPRAAF